MNDELYGLDAWIEGEPPDPGTGDGDDHPLVLTCRDCDWRFSHVNSGHVFTYSVAHVDQTGHTLLYRGQPQDFSRYVQQLWNERARAESAQDRPIKRGAAS